MKSRGWLSLGVLLLVVTFEGGEPGLAAQGSEARPLPVEKVGPNQFRMGRVTIDTSSRQVSVPGRVNENVLQLEFVANTLGGNKAYESALTLETNATSFNAALLLIGLDPGRARNAPKFHFDPATPEGDQVEIWVECPKRECQRFPAERVMYDKEKNQELGGGAWVYTGSGLFEDGRYMAELDGVIVGFVHDPSSIIEYTGSGALGRFGQIITNPNLGIKGGTEVVVTVRALPRAR